MADLPQQSTIVQYVADGIEDQYVFAFYVPLDVDIAVYVTLSGETPVPESDIKVLDVDYTVTQNLDPVTGGFVTFLPGKIPPVGAIVTLSRDVEASLNVEFSHAQNFSGENLDSALERLLLLIQQNKTYALERNLSYKVNSYLPDIEANTQLQPLPENYIWMGTASGGVAAVLLEENPDASTLRSELENNSPGTDGAGIVGYYDEEAMTPTTVRDFLNDLPNNIANKLQTGFAVCADDTGTLNNAVIDLDPALLAYALFNRFFVRFAHNNTGAMTITVNGLAQKNLVDKTGAALIGGETFIGMIGEVAYDGTNFQLLTPMTQRASGAEVLAATINTKMVTPLGLAFGYHVGSSYIILPGGLIIQWGLTSPIPLSGDTTMAFPIPFSSALAFSITPLVSAGLANGQSGGGTVTNTDITVVNTSSSIGTVAYRWIVIGV